MTAHDSPREERGLRILDTEQYSRSEEEKGARNDLVKDAEGFLGELGKDERTTTPDGRPIHHGSTGMVARDGVAVPWKSTHTVAYQYGEPGLHIGKEEGRPTFRLIEPSPDGAALTIITVKGEDPLGQMMRGDRYGLDVGDGDVAEVDFERVHGSDTVESFTLTVEPTGVSTVREFPVSTTPSMAGVRGGPASIDEIQKAHGIVQTVHDIAFGNPQAAS